eukprot:CAMPEP_0196677728 /NCGR_PEP_ID=MMETSP1090-20130531/5859_1 /TAXON_ID=37098 /ORGANISM="Isochrysis sp, Strain CCMP1244" /LENGTH=111 /DNA_ID=CAMNT_0042015835 /DNA_START=166 /DNA_END=501 /DNA_ORIENTATION=-
MRRTNHQVCRPERAAACAHQGRRCPRGAGGDRGRRGAALRRTLRVAAPHGVKRAEAAGGGRAGGDVAVVSLLVRSARGEAGAHQQVGRQRGGGVRVRGVCDVGPSCLEAVH